MKKISVMLIVALLIGVFGSSAWAESKTDIFKGKLRGILSGQDPFAMSNISTVVNVLMQDGNYTVADRRQIVEDIIQTVPLKLFQVSGKASKDKWVLAGYLTEEQIRAIMVYYAYSKCDVSVDGDGNVILGYLVTGKDVPLYSGHDNPDGEISSTATFDGQFIPKDKIIKIEDGMVFCSSSILYGYYFKLGDLTPVYGHNKDIAVGAIIFEKLVSCGRLCIKPAVFMEDD
jgi:hypothetical protein